MTTRDQLRSLYQVAVYRPLLTAGIICLSIFAALLEGIGLSFLIPVIEIAQGQAERGELSGVGEVFLAAYDFVGLPFTLEYVIGGVAVVMVIRYTSSFFVAWLRAALQTYYTRHLQTEGFDRALSARVGYYDKHGSDEVLNAIVTQATYAGNVIQRVVRLVEQSALSLMYLAVALYLAPWLTLLSAVLLGGLLYGLRWLIESGYDVGHRIAEANERIQTSVQAGTQGIRDVKLFGLVEELFEDFRRAVDQFTTSSIKKRRNEAILNNIYQMITAVTVFLLIYIALTFASLSLASLGVFLFAMFRLAPRVSTLNDIAYRTAGDLPHLVRTQQFIHELEAEQEPNPGTETPPSPIERFAFEDVSFSYGEESVLEQVSFEVELGEFVAFVGPSGAGKSTIVSLITRLYEPSSGRITADDKPIERFDIGEWRDHVSVVRQQPFIFNDTLRYNVTIGNREASDSEIVAACEDAQVTEFLNELPDGLDTVLGDEGVRLSGGQRQRVAIARALLKDADLFFLDEATSDLDSHLEERVHEAIEAAERDRMMIVIAHRLSTVMNADRIHTMVDGQITEAGTHRELIEGEGTYAELYATQTQNT